MDIFSFIALLFSGGATGFALYTLLLDKRNDIKQNAMEIQTVEIQRLKEKVEKVEKEFSFPEGTITVEPKRLRSGSELKIYG